MFVIIGAAGRVGSATASALRERGLPVRAILRDPDKAAPLQAMGCDVAIADLQQPGRLADAIAGAGAIQVVLPFRPATPDPVEDMRLSADSLFAALAAARPPRVLAISDYGAHVPDDIGMPSVFRDLEHRLAGLDGRKIVLRSAEHMHNLALDIQAALDTGTLMTFQDRVDRVQPMVAAHDVGRIAAGLLLQDPQDDMEVVHAEGPRRISVDDVAAALSKLSGRKITARSIPRAAWPEILERRMPPRLADLLIRTNDAKNRGGLIDVDPRRGELRYGSTELIDGLGALLPR